MKEFAFVDLLSVSLNFIIRVFFGMILLDVPISPWLVFGVFLVAFFLGLMKRKSEIIIIKETAILHRKAFSVYSIRNLNYSLIIVSILVILTYSVYSINNDPTNDNRLIYTIPIVALIIFRQYYLSEKNISVKKFSEVINDNVTIFLVILYIISTISLLYIF